MKQAVLIKLLKDAGRQQHKPVDVKEGRNGFHISTPSGGINLGPDTRKDVNQNRLNHYWRTLGLQPLAFA